MGFWFFELALITITLLGYCLMNCTKKILYVVDLIDNLFPHLSSTSETQIQSENWNTSGWKKSFFLSIKNSLWLKSQRLLLSKGEKRSWLKSWKGLNFTQFFWFRLHLKHENDINFVSSSYFFRCCRSRQGSNNYLFGELLPW